MPLLTLVEDPPGELERVVVHVLLRLVLLRLPVVVGCLYVGAVTVVEQPLHRDSLQRPPVDVPHLPHALVVLLRSLSPLCCAVKTPPFAVPPVEQQLRQETLLSPALGWELGEGLWTLCAEDGAERVGRLQEPFPP